MAPPRNQATGSWFNRGRNTSLTEPCRVSCSISGALGEYRRGVDMARGMVQPKVECPDTRNGQVGLGSGL